MKNIKYYIVTVLLILVGINTVYADCTNEEITKLKKEADKIEITYKHIDELDVEGVGKYLFYLTIKNIPEDFNVKETVFDTDYLASDIKDGIITETYTNGKWNFEFYSNKCNVKIKTINVRLPRYNIYSEDELCEGIDGNDFKLCGKYYDYDVSYELFEQRVKQYRAIHKIGSDTEQEKEKKENDIFFDKIIEFINENIIYIIVGVTTLVIVIIAIILIYFRRKRSVLK